MKVLKIEKESVGDLCVITITGDKFKCEFERFGDLSVFEFKGKVPSRRLMREIIKECI